MNDEITNGLRLIDAIETHLGPEWVEAIKQAYVAGLIDFEVESVMDQATGEGGLRFVYRRTAAGHDTSDRDWSQQDAGKEPDDHPE